MYIYIYIYIHIGGERERERHMHVISDFLDVLLMVGWLAVNQVSSQHRVTLLGWLLVDSSRFSSENPWKALELQVKSIVSSIVFLKVSNVLILPTKNYGWKRLQFLKSIHWPKFWKEERPRGVAEMAKLWRDGPAHLRVQGPRWSQPVPAHTVRLDGRLHFSRRTVRVTTTYWQQDLAMSWEKTIIYVIQSHSSKKS